MNGHRLLAAIGLLLVCMTAAPTAHALRCGNRLVSAGDYDFQVRERCGDPYWIENHYQTLVVGEDEVQTVNAVSYSAWYFNFGANRLLMRLLFRDGRLEREEALDRGVDELGSACAPARLREGISSGELIAYCGEPASRHVEPALVSRRIAPQVLQQSDSDREDWIYDLGGDLLYLLHLANGRVAAVELVTR